jgi:hypothetical protein
MNATKQILLSKTIKSTKLKDLKAKAEIRIAFIIVSNNSITAKKREAEDCSNELKELQRKAKNQRES